MCFIPGESASSSGNSGLMCCCLGLSLGTPDAVDVAEACAGEGSHCEPQLSHDPGVCDGAIIENPNSQSHSSVYSCESMVLPLGAEFPNEVVDRFIWVLRVSFEAFFEGDQDEPDP